MAIYDLGTASLAANGEVTGVGTTWKAPLTLIRVGATIVFKTEPVKIYTISEIISDTQINVYNPNSETVPAGTGYAILAHDGITVQGLAQDVAETLRYYQSRETEVATAVDIFKDFDQDKFSNDVNQVNTQFGEIVSIGSQVSSDASQVSADKAAAYASSVSAQNSANIAESAAESVSGALVGNFEDGVTLQSKNQVIIQFINGYARQFVWSGSFPKVVPAGSTPEATGGVGSGAWVSVGDASLRTELSSSLGSNLVGYNASETQGDGTVGGMLKALTDRTLSMDDFSGRDVGIKINAGLDFLRSQNTAYKLGGRLNLPRRQMSLDTPVVFDRVPTGEDDTGDEYLISGSGKSSTLLVAASGFPAGSAILNTNLPSGNQVQGFKLKDLGTKGGYNGLRIETASRTSIDNLKVSNATSDGVYIGNSWVNVYNQVLADQCTGNGVNFSISAQKTSTTTLAGYQLRNGGNGWRFGFMNYSAAIAPASDQNAGHGYAIAKSEGFVMIAPGAESNKGAGIMAEASSSLGANRSIAIHGAFCHENGSGTYANLLHAVSAQNTINQVRIADSTANSSIGTTPDIIADGNGCVVTVDNCVLPNGWESRNGGYIDWVHHTLYVSKGGIKGATAICNLRGTQGHGRNEVSATDSFAGEVSIVASTSPPSTASRRLAIYKLLICVAEDTGVQCEVIKQLGFVSGSVAGSPSFTWSIGSSHELIATPIGSTSGTFYFEITTDSQVVALKR